MSGYKLNEQWIEDGRMYKAVPVIGSECGSCTHGTHKDCCQAPSMQGGEYECPVGESLAVKDLGPVNEDDLLPCPFCGEYPRLVENDGWYWYFCDGCECEVKPSNSEQEAKYAWNKREHNRHDR